MPLDFGDAAAADTTTTKKKRHGWERFLIPFPSSRDKALESFTGPIGYGLEHSPWGISQGIGNVYSALASSPEQVAMFPGAATNNLWSTIRGSVEGPLSIGQAISDTGQGHGGGFPGHLGEILYGTKEVVPLLLHSMESDYKDRYGPDWKTHARDNPLFNLFDALSVAGVGARGAALAGAGERLGAAGARITLRDLLKESSRPGLLSTGTFDEAGKLVEEGTPFSRTLEYQPETGSLQSVTQPLSRSPLMRGIGDVNQALSERFPNAPVFGARSRVTRTWGATLARTMGRTLGKITGEETLNSLGDAGRTRLYWESQLGVKGDNAVLTKLRDTLAKEYESDFSDVQDPKYRDVLLAAKQEGFGKNVLIKRLDEAIKFDPTTGKNKRRYDHAYSALEEATALSERTIADSEGFTSLKNDLQRANDRLDRLDPASEEHAQTAAEIQQLQTRLAAKSGQLETMFANRRNLLRDWLDSKGTNDISEAWRHVLTKAIGVDQANEAIAIANALANKIRPSDPASWWADKIGMPDPNDLTKGAAAFRQRVGEDALFQYGGEDVHYAVPDIRLIEGTAEKPLENSAFYSPTQKWVDESMPDKMNVAQLRAAIIKHGGNEEYYNSGLDMYFQALDNNTVIHKTEFLNVLANRLNAYNLRQIVRINDPATDPSGLGTEFDLGHDGSYISRGKDIHKSMTPGGVDAFKPHPGEYYEVQFELPGPGRDTAYRGKGWGHWNRENVVVHFRFHVFMEDGKKKMLIEEIQSDWASQWRDAEKLRDKIRKAPPRDLAETARIREEMQKLQDQYTPLRDRQEAIMREIDAANQGAEGYTPERQRELAQEWQNIDNKMFGLRSDIAEYGRMLDDTGLDTDLNGLKDIPRSVLGTGTGKQSSYINSPIRWMGRFAVENNVDEVILVSREVQLVRNSRIDMRAWHGFAAQGDGGFQSLKNHLAVQKAKGREFIGYETDLPKRMTEEWGVAGVREESAYDGFIRHPMDYEHEFHGRMPGTVFKVDDAFRENAMKPKSLYQRPADWNGLPKGAVELFANGNSALHFFKNGDVSTWIHELGHIALHDLSDADRGIVEAHFGQGKPIAEWTEMQHEDFARAFEQYVREGVAPTTFMRPVFAKLSAWIKQVWEREKRVNQNIPPEVNDVFARLFRTEDGPTVFIPHRPGAPDLAGGRTSRGIPRANREIGTEVQSRIPLFKGNQLALLRSGMLNDDPRLLMEHTNRIVALARANQLREHVLDMAEPLKPGTYPNFDTQYVVKKAGRGVDKATFDALESADNAEEVANTVKKFIDNAITDDPEDFKKWKEWHGESQLYVVDKKSVDMLFKYVTGKAPGAATKPASNTLKVVDATLDSFRALLLYANPGFYVTNMLGNTGMLMLKDPASLKHLPGAMKEAVKASTRPESADPLWQRISTEMGRGPTSGSFSLGSIKDVLNAKPGEKGNLPGRAAEWWSHGLGEWGRRSGRVIDDAFRVAAWKQSAAKLGYDTDKKIKDLLDHESIEHPFAGKALSTETKQQKDLAAIRAEAEQLMLDFDSMSPAERSYLQRSIFLYPFLKASVKYPFYYAGERPISAGLMGELGGQGSKFADTIYGPRPDLPDWLQGYARGPGGYTNVGSLAQVTMPAEILQSLLNIRGPSQAGIQRPWDYTNPVVQLLVNLAQQQNEYGREVPLEQILLNELPLPAYLRYPIRKPSTQYAERDFWNTLLRSIRIAPTQLAAGMGTPPAPPGTTAPSGGRQWLP